MNAFHKFGHQLNLINSTLVHQKIHDDFINNILTKVLQHISDNMDFYHTILQLERKSRLEEKFIP